MLRKVKRIIKYYFLKQKYPIRIANTFSTLKVIKNGKSVSRFGDGEFYLIDGQDACYQKYSKEIGERLKSAILDTEKNDNCIVCLPYTLNSLRGLTKRSVEFWVDYQIGHRKMIFDNVNSHIQYFDAQVTRAYINKQDKKRSERIFSEWKKVWYGKNVLIAEGEKTRFGVGNDLLSDAESIKRIICPAENAYEKIDQIKDLVLHQNNTDICLLALGPTASILAYELSKCGIQTIDIGNLDVEYEWYLNNAEVMTAVKGKYTCEAIDGTDGKCAEDINDPVYDSQIIYRIND